MADAENCDSHSAPSIDGELADLPMLLAAHRRGYRGLSGPPHAAGGYHIRGERFLIRVPVKLRREPEAARRARCERERPRKKQ
jgi:hypothetical protein